jgi:phosphatidylserine/phosphatidylglycerophosphate/cardiolipin synthase-like enzyme
MSRVDLEGLALALDQGLVSPPFSPLMLHSHVSPESAGKMAAELERLARIGMEPRAISEILRLIAIERAKTEQAIDRVELVWSGPKGSLSQDRDTAVVVERLFASAEHQLLLTSFTIWDGLSLFEKLAERMRLKPRLEVRMLLNIQLFDENPDPARVVRHFVDDFKRRHWPSDVRLPAIFFDPRSLDPDPKKRAVLHAKCIVVDHAHAFVTSANFTEAAQNRNIEVGVLVRDAVFAESLVCHFERLVEKGILQRAIAASLHESS